MIYWYNISIFLQSIDFFCEKTNIKKNKQKEIRNRKGKRNLDRIGQKLRNIKGIKLRMGNIEAKNDENKRIKMKMIR